MAKKSSLAWVAIIALVLALLVGILNVMNIGLPIQASWMLIILSVLGMIVGFMNKKADTGFIIAVIAIGVVFTGVAAVFGNWLSTILQPVILVIGSTVLASALMIVYKKYIGKKAF